MGNIHSGTIAGKLNGVMPAHTPTGCRSDHESMPLPTVSRELALQQMRNAARELDHLDAARDFAARIAQHLAMLAA